MSPTGHALTRQLIEFNQLPSYTLHPSRIAEFELESLPDSHPLRIHPRANQALHRYWSRKILEKVGLSNKPVLTTDRAEIVLALMPPDRLAVQVQHIGAVLCGPRLRQMILGLEVRAFLKALGEPLLTFGRRISKNLHPGIAVSKEWSTEQTIQAIDELGRGTLAAAWTLSGAELAQRAELKLANQPLQAPPFDAKEALKLSVMVLKESDPQWLSSFPATL